MSNHLRRFTPGPLRVAIGPAHTDKDVFRILDVVNYDLGGAESEYDAQMWSVSPELYACLSELCRIHNCDHTDKRVDRCAYCRSANALDKAVTIA